MLAGSLSTPEVSSNGAIHPSSPPPGDQESTMPVDKVAAVCAALRDAMHAADSHGYLKAMLNSYARPGDVEGALALVKASKERELAHGEQVCESPGISNECVVR